jgi:hypothetical protein
MGTILPATQRAKAIGTITTVTSFSDSVQIFSNFSFETTKAADITGKTDNRKAGAIVSIVNTNLRAAA